MSYLKVDHEDDQLFADFLEIALEEVKKKDFEKRAKVKGFNIFNPNFVKHDETGYPLFTPLQVEAIEFVWNLALYRSLLFLVNKGVDIAFSRFAIGRIQENLHNKDLTDYLDKQMELVYSKHPEYQKCSSERFKKSGAYDYFASEFRDKSKKEIANKLAKEFVNKTIDYMIIPRLLAGFFSKTGIGNLKGPYNNVSNVQTQINPLANFKNIRSLKSMFIKPLKILASKFGITLALGSVYEQPIVYKGTVMIIGLDHSPTGFRFVNLRILSIKEGNKLVQTQIKNPPANLFKPSKEDTKTIMHKISTKSTEEIQKEIAVYGNK